MHRGQFVCEMCGAEIPAGDGARDPGGSRLCPRCVGLHHPASHGRRGGLNRPAILIATGLITLVISLLADTVAFGRAKGFGWRQLLAAGIAGVFFLCGGILRIPTLVVVGLLAGGLSLLADLLKFGASPGFGVHQVAGCGLGLLLVVLGWRLAGGSRGPRV